MFSFEAIRSDSEDELAVITFDCEACLKRKQVKQKCYNKQDNIQHLVLTQPKRRKDMKNMYYFSQPTDPFFIELKNLLIPTMNDVLNEKPNAIKKVVQLMHSAVSKIPLTYFKDAEYAKQIIGAIDAYLISDDQEIKSIARKRRTDRLDVRVTIASDCIEYLSFLPAQLENDPKNIIRYAENMDNALSLLRTIEAKKNHLKQLKLQIKKL